MAVTNERELLSILRQLFVRQWRSLPWYLLESWPWTHPGDEDAKAALEEIVRHQQDHLRRLAQLIEDRDGTIPQAGYPERFTSANYQYLALDYLLKELAGYQRQEFAVIEQVRQRCAADPEAAEVIDGLLADERQHLEMLEKLVKDHGWPEHALPRSK